MGDINRFPVPGSYNHKATSESFNGMEKVIIYYSGEEVQYLVVWESREYDNIYETGRFITKTQLELVVHAGTDVLDMDK